jgi:hypothetical protein
VALRDRLSATSATATLATVATVGTESGEVSQESQLSQSQSTESAKSRHWRFRLSYPDGRREEVRTLPAATLAEARELWPESAVEALPDHDTAARDARPPAELAALVERVARAYRTPPEELAEMKRLALADPAAAWRAFLATARTEGVQ